MSPNFKKSHPELDTTQYLTPEEQVVMRDILAEMIEKLKRAGCTAAEVKSFIQAGMAADELQMALAVVAIRTRLESRSRAADALKDLF